MFGTVYSTHLGHLALSCISTHRYTLALPLRWELVTGSFNLTCMSGLLGLPEACIVMNPEEWLFHASGSQWCFLKRNLLLTQEPLFLTFRQNLTMQPRLALNLDSSCLSLPSMGITGMCATHDNSLYFCSMGWNFLQNEVQSQENNAQP